MNACFSVDSLTIRQMILVSMATFQLPYNWDRLYTLAVFNFQDLN